MVHLVYSGLSCQKVPLWPLIFALYALYPIKLYPLQDKTRIQGKSKPILPYPHPSRLFLNDEPHIYYSSLVPAILASSLRLLDFSKSGSFGLLLKCFKNSACCKPLSTCLSLICSAIAFWTLLHLKVSPACVNFVQAYFCAFPQSPLNAAYSVPLLLSAFLLNAPR